MKRTKNGEGRLAPHHGTSGPADRETRKQQRFSRLTDSEVVAKSIRQRLAWLRFCDRILAVTQIVPGEVFWQVRRLRDGIQTEMQRLSSGLLSLNDNNEKGGWPA